MVVTDVEATKACEFDLSSSQASASDASADGKHRNLDGDQIWEEEPTAEAKREEDLPPQRAVLIVMLSVIQGYTLIGPLQHDFKVQMGIADTGSVAHVFTQAAALVQWGKFAMTLGQNVVLACFSPLQRVYLAMGGMILGAMIPPLFVFTIGSEWLGWVFASFGLIGLSLGVFECTFLNVVTPLGPLTKSWAIMGFPAAFAIINVFGMIIVSFGVPVEALFWYIVCWMPVGIGIFTFKIVPLLSVQQRAKAARQGDPSEGGASNKQVLIWNSLVHWTAWLPRLVPFMVANIVGHFVMEGALPATFNTFNAEEAPLLQRDGEQVIMNKKQFFVVFFVFVGLGDMISRRVGYCFHMDRYRSNMIALAAGILCSVFGMYLTTIGIGVTAWASAWFAFWGQGFNYAVASKYIDRFVPREHNLAAYSFWMFAGSAGAIAGSVTVDMLREWICRGETHRYLCLSSAAHHH